MSRGNKTDPSSGTGFYPEKALKRAGTTSLTWICWMDNKIRMAPVNVKINPLGGAVCIVFLLCTFVYMFGLPEWLGRREERVSMKELLSAGIVLARRGGDRVREIRRGNNIGERVKGETAEGAKEMVSQGDMESHRTIMHGFNKAFPGLMVILLFFLTKHVDQNIGLL